MLGHSGRHLSSQHWSKRHEYGRTEEAKIQARQRTKEWRKKNGTPEYNRRVHLHRAYGLTPDEWDRMFAEQDGVCAACGVAPATDVDHDHDTGRVRALLCNRCNVTAGHAGDDPDVLRSVAAYLEAHRSAMEVSA